MQRIVLVWKVTYDYSRIVAITKLLIGVIRPEDKNIADFKDCEFQEVMLGDYDEHYGIFDVNELEQYKEMV